jgi:cysteine-S-conjugate beta-lyase
MKYNLDEKIDRCNTNSLKWEFMNILTDKSDKDTIPMWVADMDFACPPPVVDAIKERVDRLIFGYSSHETPEYLGAVCGWFKKRFDWDVDPKDVFACSGVVPALNNLVRALTKKGEGVIIQRPVYYPFTTVITQNDRVVVNNSLISNEGYYSIDFDDLERKAKEKNNTMMILCSPHNPVGRVWNENELKKIGQICLDNDVTLISDEVHFDLLRKGKKHIVITTLFEQTDKIIVCTAPSKTFNLAGFNSSSIIIKNKEQKKRWKKEVGMLMLNPLAIVATTAAYTKCDEWLDEVCCYIDENMRYIDEFIKENMLKAKSIISEGTYLVWIDLNGYGFSAKELEEKMISEANVLFDMGDMFGKEGEGFIRINVACPKSTVVECMDRIFRSLE